MNTRARTGQGFDLSEIERQIRESSVRPAEPPQTDDPLAELARIVGGAPVPQRPDAVAPPPFSPAPPFSPPPFSPPPAASPTLAPLPPVSQPIWPLPPSAPPQYTRVEDDIERLLKIVDKAPASNPADLDDAMRSLDHLLRARGAEIDASTRQAATPAYDNFDDWGLRASEPAPAAAQTQLEFAPPPPPLATPETMYDPPPAEREPVHHWEHAPAEPEPETHADQPPFEKPSRKPLLLAAAVISVAALGVGGALALRGSGIASGGGQPPVIVADKGPMKVAPANPGGLEFPDQNKQILERTPAAQRPPARVVNNEEQPLDLREAVRRETGVAPPPADASPRAASAPPASADTKPTTTGSTPASDVAEPRVVRTVSIKPPEPTPPAAVPATPAPVVAVAPPSPPPAPKTLPPAITLPTASAPPPAASPSAATTPPATVPAPDAAAPATPRQKVQGAMPPPRARPPTRTARAGDTDADQTNSAAPSQAAPQPAPRRVAAVERDALAATTAPAPPEPAPAPAARPAPASGNFVVQLASEGSDQAARSAIGRMQSRFGELSGLSSSVQRREVNGQTRYRVRFGAMSRESAASTCAALRGKGQDCIVQPN